MHQKFGIATRFYGLTEDDVRRLDAWLEAALDIVSPERIFVAVNVEADKSGSLEFMGKKHPKVKAFPVTPWGKVVQAPNALLLKSAESRMDYLLFISTEYPVTSKAVSTLFSRIDENTLVVGVALSGHKMKAGNDEEMTIENASGLEIPWNTYALWSVERLVHTGFVLAADSLHDPDNAGMEEMGTIAAQQILWPGRAAAKLVALQDDVIAINTFGWNIKRQERYMKNLQSKNSRSEDQLKRLHLPTPSVLHVGYTTAPID